MKHSTIGRSPLSFIFLSPDHFYSTACVNTTRFPDNTKVSNFPVVNINRKCVYSVGGQTTRKLNKIWHCPNIEKLDHVDLIRACIRQNLRRLQHLKTYPQTFNKTLTA